MLRMTVVRWLARGLGLLTVVDRLLFIWVLVIALGLIAIATTESQLLIGIPVLLTVLALLALPTAFAWFLVSRATSMTAGPYDRGLVAGSPAFVAFLDFLDACGAHVPMLSAGTETSHRHHEFTELLLAGTLMSAVLLVAVAALT